MPKGFSLHIGLNQLDTHHYSGVPALKAAVNDALFWEKFASENGYQSALLTNEDATSVEILKQLKALSAMMAAGDILLLTYAGHGGQIMNDKISASNNERFNQTWCLYDRQLLDDELYEAFSRFPKGVRITVVSDSCHSGTVVRAEELNLTQLLSDTLAGLNMARGIASRQLPASAQRSLLYHFQQSIYQPLLDRYKSMRRSGRVEASVKLLAACQDHQQTFDGARNGIFTEALDHVLALPEYRHATAGALIQAVCARYSFPNPQFFEYGGIIPAYDANGPFDIDIPDAHVVEGYREPDLIAAAAQAVVKREIPPRSVAISHHAVLSLTSESPIADTLTGGEDVLLTQENDTRWTVELPKIPWQHGWTVAHALQAGLREQGYVVTATPVLAVTPAQAEETTREADKNNADYIAEWPPSQQQGSVKIGWHLDEHHTQLAAARDRVAQRPGARVRIAHFDTGYITSHVALPKGLNHALERNLMKGEPSNRAIDPPGKGQDGHGLGTICLLAGNKVGPEHTFDEYNGEIGGVPFADVIPVRISDSVVIWNSDHFADAVDYAIAQQCEVITMSMAGKPSARMAAAVNRAYEAGIVMVSAASNCWYKGTGALLPKCVMYPAAFERVIAATGALYTHEPYDVDFLQKGRFTITTQYMQGCWGPASRMTRALAAYTPNVPWASTVFTFLRSGGGTSSATPQIAAAAALWIAYHRAELEAKGYYQPGHQWKKVEAVRHALFTSAAKDNVFKDWKKYYGNGILRAADALAVEVRAAHELVKAPLAESSFTGLLEAAGAFFKNRRLFRSEGPLADEVALSGELMDLIQTDPQFYPLFAELDLSDTASAERLLRDEGFRQQVANSPYSSELLKEAVLAS